MTKILVSDYDQTFYLNDEDININKEKVKKFRDNGNIFIFATGRSYLDFMNIVKKYNLEYDYVILNHGSTIFDKNDNLLYNHPIDDAIVSIVKDDLNLENAINTFCTSCIESRVGFDHKDITKINVLYKDEEMAKKINDYINDKYRDYLKSYQISKLSIEIVSNIVNKANAIDYILNKFNLSDNVYTIGDGYSDIEMVKKYNGYCMKDSVNELKKVSKSEYDSVSKIIDDIF